MHSHPSLQRPALVKRSGVLPRNDLQQLQHFAELGRMSASLLHEMANPLTAALLHLEQYSDNPQTSIKEIRRSLHVLHRYIEAARQQVRAESPASSFALRQQLEQVKRILAPLAKARAVQLEIEPSAPCRLYGDSVKFQQIMTNLIVNAIDSYRNDISNGLGRPVRVQIRAHPDHINIKVIDWGEGIAASQLPLLFKPFYSTKDQRAGYGLGIGLSIVKQYVTIDFKGTILVTSSRRHGTQFTLKLPLR